MINKELYGVRLGISLMNGMAGVQLGVFRAKISRVVERIISDMESFKKSEAWIRTDDILSEINKKHAKRDDKGNYVTSNNMYVFENASARDKDISDSKEVNRTLFNERDKMVSEYKTYLEQECKEEIEKIPISLLPDSTKTEVISLLWPIIDEEK